MVPCIVCRTNFFVKNKSGYFLVMLRSAIDSIGSPSARISSAGASLPSENLNYVTSSLVTLKNLSERNTELQGQISQLNLEHNRKLDALQEENKRLQQVYERCEWAVQDAREECADLRTECVELRTHIDDLNSKLRTQDLTNDIMRNDCAIQVELSTDYTLDEVNEFITECEEGARRRDALLRNNQELKLKNEALILELESCMRNYNECKQEYYAACSQWERQESGLNVKLREMVSCALQEHKSANRCVKSTQVWMNVGCMDKSSSTEGISSGFQSCGHHTITSDTDNGGRNCDMDPVGQPTTRRGNALRNGFDWSEECASNKSSSVCSIPAVTQNGSVVPSHHAKTYTRSHFSRRDQTVPTMGYMIKIARIYTDITQKEELMQKITEQNQWVRDFNVRIIKAYRVNYQDDEYTSVIVNAFDRETQGSFLKRGKIIFNTRKCNIYEHSNITQCNRCQGFGHFARNCIYTPACRRCGGRHDTYNCTEIDPRPRCVNCLSSNSDGNFSFNVEHRPTDSRCPFRTKQVEYFRTSKFMHETNRLF